MEHPQWDPSLATGDEVVDSEHRKIFVLVGGLVDASEQGCTDQFLEAAIGDLMEYAHGHFAHEEALMTRTRYPDTEHHLQLHRAFAETAEQMADDCLSGVKISVRGLADFLYRWLNEHILAEDRRLVEHVRAVDGR